MKDHGEGCEIREDDVQSKYGRCRELAEEYRTLVKEAYQQGYDEGYSAGRPTYSNNNKKLVIDFADKEFAFMLNCAVRGALHEAGSAPRVILFMEALLPYLGYQTLWIMQQDITARLGYQESAAARNLWKKFLLKVETAINHKKP